MSLAALRDPVWLAYVKIMGGALVLGGLVGLRKLWAACRRA